MFQIQEMFENGKPNIVLKMVKRYTIKRTPIIIFIFKKSLKFGIVVLDMLNKMLVIVFIIDVYYGYGPGSQKPSLSIYPVVLEMGQVLISELMSLGFGKERHMLTFAENREYKEADSINSVQSSLKSHSLWVTLYMTAAR